MLSNQPTPTEKRLFLGLAELLIPFREPPDLSQPAPKDGVKWARDDAERRRLEQELAEFRRKYPKLAAREDALYERMDHEIRRQVFGRCGYRPMKPKNRSDDR